MTTTLIEVTRRSFGDHAEAILEAGAVFPVNNEKVPALGRGVSWTGYTDPTEDYSAAWGFAVKTGSVSGITAIDYDSKPPGRAASGSINTMTKRGFHQWVPYAVGDANRINVLRNPLNKIDIRGEGGYIVFASPNHKVLDSRLQSRSIYESLISTISIDKWKTVPNVCHLDRTYLKRVEDAGLTVNTDWTYKRLLWSVEHAAEGSRNNQLYFALAQAYGLGFSKEQIDAICHAAMNIGLDGREVHATAMSASQGKPVDILTWSRDWAEAAVAATDLELPWLLQAAAVEQHWHKPLFNKLQQSIDSGIPRRTMYRHIERLEKAGFLKEHKNPGYLPQQGAGIRSKPSNMELILPN